MYTIEELIVKFGADLKPVDQAMQSLNANIKSHLQALDDNYGALIAKAKSASLGLTMGLTMPILAAGGAALKMAMDAVESENLFEVSMGKMAASARKWSEELSKSLGINAYHLREMVGTFNVMLMSMGLGDRQALKMSESMTQLAYDMASFYNLPLDEAFQKLQSGISGEVEPLKRLGIIVSETAVKTYAYAHGIAQQGKELTENQKVLARYGVIMQATNKAQGDMARTMNSPANALRRLQERATMTAISFGQMLIPVFQRVLDIGQRLIDWLNGLSERQRVLVVFAALGVAAIGPLIGILANLVEVCAWAVPALNNVTKAVKALQLAIGIEGKAGWAKLLSNPYLLLAAAVIAAIAAIIIFRRQIGLTDERLKGLYDAWKEFMSTLKQPLNDLRVQFRELWSASEPLRKIAGAWLLTNLLGQIKALEMGIRALTLYMRMLQTTATVLGRALGWLISQLMAFARATLDCNLIILKTLASFSPVIASKLSPIINFLERLRGSLDLTGESLIELLAHMAILRTATLAQETASSLSKSRDIVKEQIQAVRDRIQAIKDEMAAEKEKQLMQAGMSSLRGMWEKQMTVGAQERFAPPSRRERLDEIRQLEQQTRELKSISSKMDRQIAAFQRVGTGYAA